MIVLSCLAAAACAGSPQPHASASDAASPITPWISGVDFVPMGAATGSGAFSATLDGSTSRSGPYTIRVHITQGGKILPHTHPDDRFITVVAGSLCYGFGTVFDETACTMYPAGSHFHVPGNRPHFGFGKEEAVYQESGAGPSAFVLPKP